MKTKKCNICKEIKNIEDFPKDKRNKKGIRYLCKVCHNLHNKKYRLENPEKVKISRKKWKINNPEKVRKQRIKWEKNTLRLKKIRSNVYKKRMLIPRNKLSENIRCLMWCSLKGKKNGRHWEDLVNYSIQDLMAHLERLFRDGMIWENYGKNGWEIDHIRPVSSFNFTSYNDPEFKECWALTNLQPLWALENIRKGNKTCQTL